MFYSLALLIPVRHDFTQTKLYFPMLAKAHIVIRYPMHSIKKYLNLAIGLKTRFVTSKINNFNKTILLNYLCRSTKQTPRIIPFRQSCHVTTRVFPPGGPWSPFENNWHLKADYKNFHKRKELAAQYVPITVIRSSSPAVWEGDHMRNLYLSYQWHPLIIELLSVSHIVVHSFFSRYVLLSLRLNSNHVRPLIALTACCAFFANMCVFLIITSLCMASDVLVYSLKS